MKKKIGMVRIIIFIGFSTCGLLIAHCFIHHEGIGLGIAFFTGWFINLILK